MSQIHELTDRELDLVSGGDLGLHTTNNSVGFTIPGMLNLVISTDGDQLYLTGTVGKGHGGSIVLTPPAGGGSGSGSGGRPA